MGIRSLAIFGSVAGDEATEDSDLELLVEFDRPAILGVGDPGSIGAGTPALVRWRAWAVA